MRTDISVSRFLLACWLLALPAAPLARAAEEASTEPLHGPALIRFATVEQGKAVLGADDLFARSLSRFDRQSRLGTDRDVTTAQFLEFAASHVRPWADADIERVSAVVRSLSKKLEPLRNLWPEDVLLIHTTGLEEGQAAYTRGSAIILPTGKLRLQDDHLERLIAHELFHVLSRNDPELRKKLYAVVGFTPCQAIELPAELRERKITNPDAPAIDCTIELTIDGRQALCAPVLFASAESYDPRQGGGFFKYLQFRLMEVQRESEAAGNAVRPVLRDGEAVLHEPRGVEDYFAHIGRNTGYIIHPDEVLADNFVLVVTGRKDVATPRILEKMRELLAVEE